MLQALPRAAAQSRAPVSSARSRRKLCMQSLTQRLNLHAGTLRNFCPRNALSRGMLSKHQSRNLKHSNTEHTDRCGDAGSSAAGGGQIMADGRRATPLHAHKNTPVATSASAHLPTLPLASPRRRNASLEANLRDSMRHIATQCSHSNLRL